ncbi:serine/threonine-protein kinase [Dulcicalothrix desertica]|nr:serine/threonine-protein kinase [Dulcicalothrix desertica]TWH50069.1 serine/threonine-protein kinase [Dulcicalothrix desertica PCC 7102]
MDICCTRPSCPKPINSFPELDDASVLKNISQQYCITCGMPLILDGRYIPIKKLRQGGFGAAFLSYDRRTPGMRECIVKQLQPSPSLKLEQIKKVTQLFHREAEALEKLGAHPQIPDLYAFFAINPGRFKLQIEEPIELFYLVQQYIDGENLEQELSRKAKFTEAEVFAVLEAILHILDFAHNNNSIHRDIKPSNIMRARDGRLYLVDFGAVKQVVATGKQQDANSTLDVSSVSITNVYTPGFAPPEQLDGRAIFPSSDLYALAATCLLLLTGKPPTSFIDAYTGTWNWRLSVNINERNARIIERMLKEKPIDRFQSAKDVLDALKQKTPVSQQDFSTLDWLVTPFVTGFEIGLLAVFFNNLLAKIGIIFAIIILGVLFYAQYKQIIFEKHLFIIVGVTFALVLLLLPILPSAPILGFNLANNHLLVTFFALLSGIFGVVLVGLSQLIYQLLSFIK